MARTSAVDAPAGCSPSHARKAPSSIIASPTRARRSARRSASPRRSATTTTTGRGSRSSQDRRQLIPPAFRIVGHAAVLGLPEEQAIHARAQQRASRVPLLLQAIQPARRGLVGPAGEERVKKLRQADEDVPAIALHDCAPSLFLVVVLPQ